MFSRGTCNFLHARNFTCIAIKVFTMYFTTGKIVKIQKCDYSHENPNEYYTNKIPQNIFVINFRIIPSLWNVAE